MTAQSQSLSWRWVSYNTGRFTCQRTISDVLSAIKGSVVALQGTGLSLRVISYNGAHSTMFTRSEGYLLYQWPWGTGKYTNNNCGVALALDAKRVFPHHVVQTYQPLDALQRRAGALRAKCRGCCDFGFCVLYRPVNPDDNKLWLEHRCPHLPFPSHLVFLVGSHADLREDPHRPTRGIKNLGPPPTER